MPTLSVERLQLDTSNFLYGLPYGVLTNKMQSWVKEGLAYVRD